MHRTLVALIAAGAITGGAGCGSSARPVEDGRPAPSSPAPASGTPAAARRDPSTLAACEIVRPHEAAALIGGPLLNEPPAGYANCAYVVDVGGRTESYRLAFTTPEPYVAMLATQDENDKGERIPDLLDEAYVQPQAVGEGVSVVAIARGDLALEVSGNRKEPALAIARLAASRIR